MGAHENPRPRRVANRLLAMIREAGHITSGDLARATGVTSNNQPARLDKAIAAGLVAIEVVPGKGRGQRCWVWMGAERMPAPPHGGEPASANVTGRDGNDLPDCGFAAPSADPRHKPAPRTCLSCGKTFNSAHAGNRCCASCKQLAARAGSGLDEFAAPRYHSPT